MEEMRSWRNIFDSPEHAINVIRRMLHVSGMVLDNASPAVLGHLSKTFVSLFLRLPLVDEDVGICASIRIVNPQSMTQADFVKGGTANRRNCLTFGSMYPYDLVCGAGATRLRKDHIGRLGPYHGSGQQANIYN